MDIQDVHTAKSYPYLAIASITVMSFDIATVPPISVMTRRPFQMLGTGEDGPLDLIRHVRQNLDSTAKKLSFAFLVDDTCCRSPMSRWLGEIRTDEPLVMARSNPSAQSSVTRTPHVNTATWCRDQH